jgi:HEAT repeat protein
MPLFGGPPNVEILYAKRDLDGLISALSYQKDSKVATAAAAALGELGDTRATMPLITALNTYIEEVRLAAMKSLGKLKAPQALEPLIAFAFSPMVSDASRNTATKALEQFGEAAIETLVATLKSSDPRVREQAAKMLEKFKWDPRNDTQRIMLAVALNRWEEAASYGSIATEMLIEALGQNLSLESKQELILVLGNLKDSRAVKPLEDILNNYTLHSLAVWKIEELTEYAIMALDLIGDAQAIPALLRTVVDNSRLSKRIGLPPSSIAISIHNAALQSLTAHGTGVIDMLLEMAKPVPYGNLKQPLLNDKEAISVLQELGNFAINSIVPILSDKDSQRLKQAVMILRTLDWQPKDQTQHLLCKIVSEDRQTPENYEETAIEPLINLLSHPNSEVRRKCAEVLGKLRDPRSVEVLATVLEDKESSVVLAAAISLGKIGDVPTLMGLLSHPNSVVRRKCAEILGELQDPRNADALAAVLEDKESSVVLAAAISLGKIGDVRAMETLLKWIESEQHGRGKAELVRFVLKHLSAKVPVEFLREVVTMNDVIETDWRWHDYDDGGDSIETILSTSDIRELARQELVRRGIQI